MSRRNHRGQAARQVQLLLTIRHQPAPLDRTPTNRKQRRQADRALRRIEVQQRKGGPRRE